MPTGMSMYILFVLLSTCIRFKVDMAEFPIISRINETLLELEEFKQTAPTKQQDCPPELRT